MDRGDFLLGVGTVVGGALLTIGVEWLRGWVERRQRRNDRREDFQRQTLLDLQDTLDVLGKHAAIVAILRDRAVPLPGRGKDVPYDNPHAEAVLEAGMRMTTLAERVGEPKVRTSVKQLDDALRQSLSPDGKKTANEVMEQVRALRRQTNEQVGELLRKA